MTRWRNLLRVKVTNWRYARTLRGSPVLRLSMLVLRNENERNVETPML